LSYLTHRRQLTVEWGHCDPAGIVFNSRFFEFFDHSTWLLFEHALALPPAGIGAIYGVSMPLVDAKASFLLPAKLGDLVEIETTIGEFRRSACRGRSRDQGVGRTRSERCDPPAREGYPGGSHRSAEGARLTVVQRTGWRCAALWQKLRA
jgi:YbgC/YbaW family acyl-CoA thioester hydrolase